MQRADDASARGSVLDEAKGHGDASRSKAGKVDPVDKKAERRGQQLKLKTTSKREGFQPFGLVELMKASDIISVISTGNRVIGAYVAEPSALKEEKHWLEEEVNKRDVHLEVASAETAKLRALLEKSRLTEDRLRKERDEARRRADEIASGSHARSSRHSSCLERIRSYLVTLHAQEEIKAQLCYWRGARISLEKIVEAEYEFPPGLLENYTKEEEEYLAKVESFNADSLGDDILFPTLPPPPPGPSRDVASQVPEGTREHGSFLSPQDNQDGDQVRASCGS
ncbi:hypothetical protein AALP_AAs50253U000300 [Arabis alpina]|uniref:Uncharacterized protein n=1 Tax=Arabis alpina TaxID=50452 RepID=A0A087G2P7_ARAAL|nr:hypothetical protein AALP_AAs50253U000300 [Arabis alpina]